MIAPGIQGGHLDLYIVRRSFASSASIVAARAVDSAAINVNGITPSGPPGYSISVPVPLGLQWQEITVDLRVGFNSATGALLTVGFGPTDFQPDINPGDPGTGPSVVPSTPVAAPPYGSYVVISISGDAPIVAGWVIVTCLFLRSPIRAVYL